jgi:hypothetical protein
VFPWIEDYHDASPSAQCSEKNQHFEHPPVLQAGAGRYESEYPHETLSAALKYGYCFAYEILL